jgi:PTS system nitrogen regulatory IIA component
MDITELIEPARVALDVRTRDKAHLITDLSRIAAGHASPLSAATVEAALLARERLGSTGLGAGFALPHARIEGLTQFLGVFVRLARPIEFDAIDGKPVDLLFLLLIPAGAVDHVGALAAVSRRFRDSSLVGRLRKAPNQAAAFSLLTEP